MKLGWIFERFNDDLCLVKGEDSIAVDFRKSAISMLRRRRGPVGKALALQAAGRPNPARHTDKPQS